MRSLSFFAEPRSTFAPADAFDFVAGCRVAGSADADVDSSADFCEELFPDFVAAEVALVAADLLAAGFCVAPFAGVRFVDPVFRPACARLIDSAGSDGTFSRSVSCDSV